MIAVAITDLDWFSYLREFPFEEVNFWTPTPWRFRALKAGEKFYFLLKSPIRKIGGYGYFGHYEEMSLRDAWEKFGKANGVENFSILLKKINNYATRNSIGYVFPSNPTIGCILLEKPVFLKDDEFFEPEKYQKDVPSSVIKFKTFIDDFPAYAIRNRLEKKQKKEQEKNQEKVQEKEQEMEQETNQEKGPGLEKLPNLSDLTDQELTDLVNRASAILRSRDAERRAQERAKTLEAELQRIIADSSLPIEEKLNRIAQLQRSGKLTQAPSAPKIRRR